MIQIVQYISMNKIMNKRWQLNLVKFTLTVYANPSLLTSFFALLLEPSSTTSNVTGWSSTKESDGPGSSMSLQKKSKINTRNKYEAENISNMLGHIKLITNKIMKKKRFRFTEGIKKIIIFTILYVFVFCFQYIIMYICVVLNTLQILTLL